MAGRLKKLILPENHPPLRRARRGGFLFMVKIFREI